MPSFLSLDGFSIEKRLHAGPRGEVYAATQQHDGVAVVLKRFPEGAQGLESAQQELAALQQVSTGGVPRALGLELDGAQPILVLERMPGIPLLSWIDAQTRSLSDLLQLATQLAEVLAAVHDAGLIHRDVTPSNVLVDTSGTTSTLRIYLIDFGRAIRARGAPVRSDRELREVGPSSSLPYVSPEQTGRMNRTCDARSDLYMLGATLYHALTGAPPFCFSDPLELIHAHIARRPVAPHELVPSIPPILSQLVLRLLQKEPTERYSTTRALLQDLYALRDQLARDGRFDESFQLGSADRLTQICFTSQPYGRTHELARLADAYESAKAGRAAPVFLTGASGSGKSFLVNAFSRTLGDTSVPLLVGRFSMEASQPYGAWIQIVDTLTQQLLVAGNARAEASGARLRAHLGKISQCLVDWVPDLASLLGEVPPLPQLPPRESQARLSLALQRFLRACGSRRRPLVLFLDDLQWIDAGSRLLLEDLLSSTGARRLLVLTACQTRDSQLPPVVTALADRIRERGVDPQWIELGALERDATSDMLADALHLQPRTALELACLIEPKTGHRPLLIRQLIEHLHDTGLLRYSAESGFTWDAAEVSRAPIPDNAVDLLTARIPQLTPEHRKLLALASCLGSRIHASALAAITQSDSADTQQGLEVLCLHGLLSASPSGLRFVHNRIRESANELLTPDERARLHAAIGRHLLESIDAAAVEERAAEIADHLNRGARYVDDDLRLDWIRISGIAAKRAIAGAAWELAAGHLEIACAQLHESDWETHRSLYFETHLLGSDCAFQCRRFDDALALLDRIEGRDLAVLERVQVAVKRIEVMSLIDPPEVCLDYVLDVLRTFGIRWPREPSHLRVWLATSYIRRRIFGKSSSNVLQPAQSVDPRWLAPLLLLAPAGGAFLRTNVRLVMLASSLALRRYLEYGYVRRPGFTIAAHAYVSFQLLRDGDYARHCVKLVRELNERVPDPLYNPRAELLIHATLLPLLQRRRDAIAPLESIAETALELGDLEFSSYARFLHGLFRALAGDRVPECAARLRAVSEWVRRSGHSYPEAHLLANAYAVLLEHEPALDAHSRQVHQRLIATGDLPYVRTVWMMILCLHGRFDLALEHSDALGRKLFYVGPFVHVADHALYRGLSCAALADGAAWRQRRAYVREVRRSIRELRKWARNGPDFVHMKEMLAAELARLRGDSRSAQSLFERAARRAKQQDFTHHAALALERCAQMLARQHRDVDAAATAQRARALYEEWGAISKLQQLRSAVARAGNGA